MDQYIHCKLEELSSKYDFSNRMAIVLASGNNQVDISDLPDILIEPSAYIGVISSQKRWKLTEKQLIKSGVKKEKLLNIHAPSGLDIEVDTSEEIALSIGAQIIIVKRSGTGVSLSNRK